MNNKIIVEYWERFSLQVTLWFLVSKILIILHFPQQNFESREVEMEGESGS